MPFEYKLIKIEDGSYEEIEITIQEEAIEDFCEMMDWDREKFANNTVRYPIISDDEEDEEKEPKKKETTSTKKTINSTTSSSTSEYFSYTNVPKAKGKKRSKYTPEMYDLIKKKMDQMGNIVLCKEIKKELNIDITPQRLGPYMNYNKLKRKIRIYGPGDVGGGFSSNARKEPGSIKAKRKNRSKYPEEMVYFCKQKINHLSNKELCKELNEKYNLDLTVAIIKDYLQSRRLKRDRKLKIKKIGPPKKYTDEVVQFLRYNINNFSRKDLCEELENRFNIKVSPEALGQNLN